MKQAIFITASVLGLAFALAFYHYFTTDQTGPREKLTWQGQPILYQDMDWHADDQARATANGLTGQPVWQFWGLPGLQQPARGMHQQSAIKPPLRLPQQHDPSLYAMGNK